MMATAMVSREDADILRNGINQLVDDFERLGYERSTIGVILASIGLGIVQVHIGHGEAMSMIATLQSAMMADHTGLQ